jgi:hypothetical protein
LERLDKPNLYDVLVEKLAYSVTEIRFVKVSGWF